MTERFDIGDYIKVALKDRVKVWTKDDRDELLKRVRRLTSADVERIDRLKKLRSDGLRDAAFYARAFITKREAEQPIERRLSPKEFAERVANMAVILYGSYGYDREERL